MPGLGDALVGLAQLWIAYKAGKEGLARLAPAGRSSAMAQVNEPARGRKPRMDIQRTPGRFPIGQRIAAMRQMVRKGRTDPEWAAKFRMQAMQILSARCGTRGDGLPQYCVAEKDWRREIFAIFYAVKQKVRYSRDPHGVDTFAHPKRTIQMGGGDCLPEGTLLLRKGYDLVPIEQIQAGDRIWGYEDWTTVGNVWFKGTLPVDAIHLNNGTWLRATPDHALYVARCDRHRRKDLDKPCQCRLPERRVERIPVSEAKRGDVILSPERLPFGSRVQDADLALIQGLYLADGWVQHEGRSFSIAGKDGFPKEAQKRTVQGICATRGIATYWHERYITIHAPEWTAQMQRMGHRAPEKAALSIDLDEGAAGALLRGLMADSGANANGGRTFTTTSRDLALQVRLLHKMFGVSCGEAFIADHGGLGKHPIWRLVPRIKTRTNGTRDKILRVKSVARAIGEVPCWDVSTEDHYVYLPEHDATVSNCDDLSVLLACLLLAAGYDCRFRVIRTKNARDWDHVYVVAHLPNSDEWVALDASVDRPPGWEAPASMVAARKDFPVE